MTDIPVRVWCRVEIEDAAARPPLVAADILTPRERSQYDGFQFEKRRTDWLNGRVAAKRLIVAMVQARHGVEAAPRAVEIATSPTGAPTPVNAIASGLPWVAPEARLPLELSISHSRGAAFAAAFWWERDVPGARIGADLEWVERRPPDLFDDYFTAEEHRYCGEAEGDRDERATVVWSAKESTLKAAGLGLTVDTRAVTCLPSSGAVALTIEPSGPWQALSIAAAPPLSSSIARAVGCWQLRDGFAFTVVVAR